MSAIQNNKNLELTVEAESNCSSACFCTDTAAQYAKQNEFYIRIAQKTIRVQSLHKNLKNFCKNYLIETDKVDCTVSISQSDIDRERRLSEMSLRCDDGWLETLALNRRLAETFLDYDTFLMHGAAVAYRGKAYLFIAKSGTGKTTHVKLWLKNLDEAFVVNGDKPFIIAGKKPLVCGTPWCGKEELNRNCVVPLAAIIILERAERNVIHEIPFAEGLPVLLQQSYFPTTLDKQRKKLSLICSLFDTVELYRFSFNNFKEDAFEVSFNRLVKGMT